MFDHLWHLFAIGGAAIGGVLLIFKRKAQPSAPKVSETPIGPVPEETPPRSPQVVHDGLTARGAAELVGYEAIVLEAYKDSENIWTWGIGVTDASGHKVERYIDHPQALAYCLEVFIWLLRAKYLPSVRQAFQDHELTEAQLAAALSFHYNTGAILHASWVNMWIGGQMDEARASFMTWKHPPEVVSRRQKECNLFFDGTWSGDGRANILRVLKPSYQPDFHHPTRVDVLAPLHQLIGE